MRSQLHTNAGYPTQRLWVNVAWMISAILLAITSDACGDIDISYELDSTDNLPRRQLHARLVPSEPTRITDNKNLEHLASDVIPDNPCIPARSIEADGGANPMPGDEKNAGRIGCDEVPAPSDPLIQLKRSRLASVPPASPLSE